MSGEYFQKLPEVRYNNVLVRDITRRVNFLKQSIENPYVFLPYTVEEGDRAEDIAYHYYGDPNYAWLVYLSNNIIDPYHDWPMDEDTFHNYLIDKYAEKSGKKGYEVIDWARDTTDAFGDNIVYYYKEV
jgi:Base plate wedge protein 53